VLVEGEGLNTPGSERTLIIEKILMFKQNGFEFLTVLINTALPLDIVQITEYIELEEISGDHLAHPSNHLNHHVQCFHR